MNDPLYVWALSRNIAFRCRNNEASIPQCEVEFSSLSKWEGFTTSDSFHIQEIRWETSHGNKNLVRMLGWEYCSPEFLIFTLTTILINFLFPISSGSQSWMYTQKTAENEGKTGFSCKNSYKSHWNGSFSRILHFHEVLPRIFHRALSSMGKDSEIPQKELSVQVSAMFESSATSFNAFAGNDVKQNWGRHALSFCKRGRELYVFREVYLVKPE